MLFFRETKLLYNLLLFLQKLAITMSIPAAIARPTTGVIVADPDGTLK